MTASTAFSPASNPPSATWCSVARVSDTRVAACPHAATIANPFNQALRLAVPTTSDSRFSGFPTPYYWVGTPWGLANYWRDYPFRIPCAPLVHMEILAIYCLGSRLLGFRPIRHERAGLSVHPLPTILLLAGDDKYPRPGPGLAIPGLIEIGDIAPPIHRRRQQPQAGDVPALASARAARLLAKDHHVLIQFPRNPQPQAHAGLGVLAYQLTDGAESKRHPSGRLQGLRQIHSRPHRVDGSVQLLAGQGSMCPRRWAAANR